MNKYQEAINYLWKSYDENKIYGIASRGYLEMLQELVNKVDSVDSFEWIPISEKLPDEHDSIFARLYGTDKWDDAFWRTKSKEVLVTIEYEGGIRSVTSSYTTDGKWELEKRVKLRKCKVVAWMPLPKQYKEKENDIR